MYHTNSSERNTQLVVSQYLGVCRVSETAGKHPLLTRNDGRQMYHWAHEFTALHLNDVVSYTRKGEVIVGMVIAIDVEAGEVELLLENGERGWASAHAIKTVLARGAELRNA